MKKILMLCIMVLFVSGNAYAAFSNSSGDHSKTVSTQVSINSVCHVDPQSGLSNQQDKTFNLSGRNAGGTYQYGYWTVSATDDADLGILHTSNADSDIYQAHYIQKQNSPGIFAYSGDHMDFNAGTDFEEFKLGSTYYTSTNTPEAGTYTTTVTITCADDDGS